MRSLPVLSGEEIDACKKGGCNQCGVCCSAMNIQNGVPGVPGDPMSALVPKRAGEKCPQEVIGKDGKSSCLVHGQKGSPEWVCGAWNGALVFMDMDTDKRYTAYESATEALALRLLSPGSLAEIQRHSDFLAIGAFPEAVEMASELLYIQERFRDTLKTYLHDLQVFDEVHFERLHLRTLLDREDFSSIAREVLLTCNQDIRRRFYWWFITSVPTSVKDEHQDANAKGRTLSSISA